MLKYRPAVLALASFGLFSHALLAGADDAIGYVRAIQGDAYLVQDGRQAKVAMDTPVTRGSLIKTEAGASLGVTFKDNTVMSLGPVSELRLDQYVYAPRLGDFKLDATLDRGTLAYLSGAIAKQNPAGVMLRTPTGAIGVRGSHFAIKIVDQ